MHDEEMRFFVLGVVFLLGCGEEFTSAEVLAFDPPSSGEGGEPAATGGASSTGGTEAGGMAGTSAPGGAGAGGAGGSGSMSGTGGNPSGGSENIAGAGGSGGNEAGSGGSGGTAGAPWMPSRCVEPPEGVEVRLEPEAFTFSVFGLLRANDEIELRWWLSVDGECPPDGYIWSEGVGGPPEDDVTWRIEPEEHDTPEGHQTHVIIMGRPQTGASTFRAHFGGCVPWSGPLYQNDYSATKPENVGVYVSGELVAGCEP
jgi:hypothetical protein